MQVALIAEVIVEHRFIGVGRCCNFVGACAGQTLLGEMILGCGEDASRGFGVFYSFSSASHFKNSYRSGRAVTD